MESINKKSLNINDPLGSIFIRTGRSINGYMDKINGGTSPHTDEGINKEILYVAKANRSSFDNYVKEYTILSKHSVDKV